MELTERELFRLHIEAVWDVNLPPLQQNEVEMQTTALIPAWQLYYAEIDRDRIQIWRPGVEQTARPSLLRLADEALTLPTEATSSGITREVVLRFTAQPRLDYAPAQSIARPMTIDDHALIETFAEGEAKYFLAAQHAPVIGVARGGHLLCIAHSARRTNAACELGIETHPAARRQGYALAATILWTRAVLQEGLIPFYSALVENLASLQLADAAGYRIFARGVTIER